MQGDKMNRALRRHHRHRVIERRRKHYWGNYDTPLRRGKLAKTAKRCSCYGCSRNLARRHLGRVTRKEELAALEEAEQIQEIEVHLDDQSPHYEIEKATLEVMHARAELHKAQLELEQARFPFLEVIRIK
jgi:hypothetical protein